MNPAIEPLLRQPPILPSQLLTQQYQVPTNPPPQSQPPTQTLPPLRQPFQLRPSILQPPQSSHENTQPLPAPNQQPPEQPMEFYTNQDEQEDYPMELYTQQPQVRIELSPELRDAMTASRHATQYNQQPRGRASPYGNPRPGPSALRSTSTHERDPIEEPLDLPSNYLEQENIPQLRDEFHSTGARPRVQYPVAPIMSDLVESTGARPRDQNAVAPRGTAAVSRPQRGAPLNPDRKYYDELDPPERKYPGVEFECPICGEKLDTEVELRLHKIQCTKTCFICEFCGKELKTKAGLKNHARFMHTRKKIPKKKDT